MAALLIVDDNLLNLKLMHHLLELKGHTISTANNADEALNQLSRFKPDLILMDLQLLGMNGFELTKIIKNDPKNKSIPIVAVTAFAMEQDKERALSIGCDGYITKPIDINTIHLTIADFIKRFKK